MKNVKCLWIACVLYAIMPIGIQAQLRWPVEGAEAGKEILYRPQQYIRSEFNFGTLFIGALEGTRIVAPSDGTITHFSINYKTSLSSTVSWKCANGRFDDGIAQTQSELRKGMDPHYLTGSVTIRLADNSFLRISGLKGNVQFKTGMKVKAGDCLGVSSFSYYKIKEPHISIDVSKEGKADDPMAPFGLETTFVASKAAVVPENLTKEEAEEDLTVLLTAYKECFPSLDELVTEEEIDAFANSVRWQYEKGIAYNDFYDIVCASTSRRLVNDSHIAVLTPSKKRDVPIGNNLVLMAQGDRLFVGTAHQSVKEYVGRRVVAVDGVPDSAIIRKARLACTLLDGDNQSKVDYSLAKGYLPVNFASGSKIEFEDGEVYNNTEVKQRSYGYVPSLSSSTYLKRLLEIRSRPFFFRELNDSTVLFSLHTFDLDETQVESIADSIRSFSNYPNMVIDVRDNPGGREEVLSRLASFFLTEPSVKLNSYSKVMSNKLYPSFAHTLNYSSDVPIFEDYQPVEGKEGFYKFSENSSIQPDSSTNYKGKLYLLINETSCSAATLFPAIMVRNHRGVAIGRETGSGYHFMTALKFADFILPHSKIQVRIPLVKCVFDDEVSERTPANRGLMPDYEVPLTWDEFFTDQPDPIMAKAMELIQQGVCLGDNPFVKKEVEIVEDAEGRAIVWIVVGLSMLVCIFLWIKKHVFSR